MRKTDVSNGSGDGRNPPGFTRLFLGLKWPLEKRNLVSSSPESGASSNLALLCGAEPSKSESNRLRKRI